jgi:heme exporter protein D
VQFENLHDLWEMSGHGPFVWSAYAITLVVLIAVLYAPLARQRRFFAQQQQIEKRRTVQAQTQRGEPQAKRPPV